MEILEKLDDLLQAARDRKRRAEGTRSEAYYKGQFVAYHRAYETARQILQPTVQAEAQVGPRLTCVACGTVTDSLAPFCAKCRTA